MNWSYSGYNRCCSEIPWLCRSTSGRGRGSDARTRNHDRLLIEFHQAVIVRGCAKRLISATGTEHEIY